MDKKDIQGQPQFNDPINWKSLGFFSAEDYLLYIFKKTEKITAALYLVSGLLKDEEPLKWELRDRGMDLISSSFTASSSIPGDKNAVIQSLFTASLETISLLNVAKISNLISDMNHALLVREIDNILALLRDRLAQSAENAGYILSESFFRTPSLFNSGLEPAKGEGSKGHAPSSAKGAMNEGLVRGHVDSKEAKNKRQESIVDVLKHHSNLTIKDFTKVIKDVSEKTIQRELLELVSKGVIKKEGERRWSRYSLNG
ncbi:MAG: DeoR family transcriptional regulator [Patescibacteria group bacterium]|nr:DeoR family transcriptional regulator [Patescibacteria group bacterium]